MCLAFSIAMTERWRPSTQADLWLDIGGGALAIAGNYGLLFSGQQYLTSPAAAIIVGLTPVLTPMCAAAYLVDERPTCIEMAGLAFSLVGVVIIRGWMSAIVSGTGC